jgi:acyl carrier protein
MTETSFTAEQLSALPRSERQEVLETLVLEQFKTALLMDADEELPLESGFFDLGLTSLRLIDIRQRLEELLGMGIDTTALFNRPTIDQLVAYLLHELAEAVPAGPQGVEAVR